MCKVWRWKIPHSGNCKSCMSKTVVRTERYTLELEMHGKVKSFRVLWIRLRILDFILKRIGSHRNVLREK